jgi:hypothetical protein
MTGLGDEGNTIYSPDRMRQLQAAQSQKARKKESPDPSGIVHAPLEDKVEIGVTAAPVPDSKDKNDVKLTSQQIERYTALLKEMPDIRQDEVDRVEAILAEDGYGSDAISVVVDRLISEG